MMIGLSAVQRRMHKKKELKNVTIRRLTVMHNHRYGSVIKTLHLMNPNEFRNSRNNQSRQVFNMVMDKRTRNPREELELTR